VQTLPRASWANADCGLDLSPIKNLVAVHRLREVSCLYGFTRFEAAPTSADGELEDIQLAVRGAALAIDADWLPAVEQFGEGLFIHFDEAAIVQWLRQGATQQRHEKLMGGYRHWRARFTGNPPKYPGTAYTLLHSLSHALMVEIALDCGYPASSLKERVYALSSTGDGITDRVARAHSRSHSAAFIRYISAGEVIAIATKYRLAARFPEARNTSGPAHLGT
jgi:hypothetical protein